METPLELVFKHVEPTDEIKALVHEKVDHLDRIFDGITSCHVYIRAPHQSQQTGNLYEVTIEVRIPGKELVVNRHQDDKPERAHLKVAVRDAFDAMQRELKGAVRKLQGDVKHHDGPLQGKIVQIRHDEGFGQIMATDNRLIYFHENSVVDGSFADLKQGTPVELVVQTDESEIGPQASTVRPISPMQYDPGQ
jgi:ribosome-associated translation inhibitor RaiA